EDSAELQPLPESLGSVLYALAADHEYLTEGDVFPEDMLSTWIDLKRTTEIDPFRFRPHPHEFELYYDIRGLPSRTEPRPAYIMAGGSSAERHGDRSPRAVAGCGHSWAI